MSQQAALHSTVLTGGQAEVHPSHSPSLIEGFSREWPGRQSDGGPSAATPCPGVHGHRLCPCSELCPQDGAWGPHSLPHVDAMADSVGPSVFPARRGRLHGADRRPEAMSGGLPVPTRHCGRGAPGTSLHPEPWPSLPVRMGASLCARGNLCL